MPARPADPLAVAAAEQRLREGGFDALERADVKLLCKHFMRELESRAPGRSVEVRVPPFAAAQVIPGPRHTRGTPPAVIEMDPSTWLALATGGTTWSEAEAEGRLRASGERADLSEWLPLS